MISVFYLLKVFLFFSCITRNVSLPHSLTSLYFCKGPQLTLCWYGGKYVIMDFDELNNPLSTILLTMNNSPPTLTTEVSYWNTWRIDMNLASTTGYFNVYKNGYKMATVDMTKISLGTSRRLEFGSHTMMDNCATADMKMHFRGIMVIQGKTLPNDPLCKTIFIYIYI